MPPDQTTPALAEPGANLLGLVQDCKEHPDDDDLYGILCDYLEDHGESERAELIRRSRAAEQPGLDRAGRAAQLAGLVRLRQAHDAGWLAPWADAGLADLRRSWVRVRTHFDELRSTRMAETLAAAAPWVERLRLEFTEPPVLERFARHPVGANFAALDLRAMLAEEAGLRALAASPWAGGVRELACRPSRGSRHLFADESGLICLHTLHLDGPLRAADLRDLVDSATAPRLRHLALEGAALTPELLVLLLRAESLAGLRSFGLLGGGLHHLSASAFADAPLLQGLRRLELRGCRLRGAALAALVESAQAGSLESLVVADNLGDDAFLQALARNANLVNLRHLDLTGLRLGRSGLQALARTRTMGRLESLKIDIRNPDAEEGLQALFASEAPASLGDLTIAGHSVSEATWRTLFTGPLAERLRRLRVSAALPPTALDELLRGPALPNLEALELFGNPLDERHWRRLAESPHRDRLVWLGLPLATGEEAGLPALAASAGLPALMFLTLSLNFRERLRPAVRQALLGSPRRARGFFIDDMLGDREGLHPMRSPYQRPL